MYKVSNQPSGAGKKDAEQLKRGRAAAARSLVTGLVHTHTYIYIYNIYIYMYIYIYIYSWSVE